MTTFADLVPAPVGRFDGVELAAFEVTPEEMAAAIATVEATGSVRRGKKTLESIALLPTGSTTAARRPPLSSGRSALRCVDLWTKLGAIMRSHKVLRCAIPLRGTPTADLKKLSTVSGSFYVAEKLF